MHFLPRPGARALLAAAMLVGAATMTVAQQPAPSAQAIEPTGPVRSLSIDEAVQLALQQNLGIQVERLNPQLQDYSIAQALASYTPIFGGAVNYQHQDQPPSSFLSGADTTITSSNFGGNAQVQKFFTYGTNAVVSWDSSRYTSNNIFNSFNPQLTGNVDVQVSQPLLRNFKFDTVRQQIYQAKKNREISDVGLQQTIAITTRQVKNAYWDYVFSINSLAVAKQSLDLAQESLRNTKSRVEIGTLAPIDIVQAESEVASREEAVILAEASIGQTEDGLRTLIFDPKTPQFWNMNLKPTDTAPFQLQAVDVRGAVSRALNERTDLIAARKRMDVTDYNLKYFKNQTLPGVNLQFDVQQHRAGRHAVDPRRRRVPTPDYRDGREVVLGADEGRARREVPDLAVRAQRQLPDRQQHRGCLVRAREGGEAAERHEPARAGALGDAAGARRGADAARQLQACERHHGRARAGRATARG